MSVIKWPVLMRAATRGLGLRPAEFWALTPAELWLMLGGDNAQAPLQRSGLEALMAAFPDTGRVDEKGSKDE